MKDPRSQEVYIKEECAITTLAPMLVEIIKNTASTQAAVESERNETVRRQDAFLSLLPLKRIGE